MRHELRQREEEEIEQLVSRNGDESLAGGDQRDHEIARLQESLRQRDATILELTENVGKAKRVLTERYNDIDRLKQMLRQRGAASETQNDAADRLRVTVLRFP